MGCWLRVASDLLVSLFLFKQKTAYELRISDWSSDVCSSDLNHLQQGAQVTAISLSDEQLAWARERHDPGIEFRKQDYRDVRGQYDAIVSVEMVEALGREYWPTFMDAIARNLKPGGRAAIQYISMRDELFDAYARRSEAHTSELQSLMRTSYAVFCLKKK